MEDKNLAIKHINQICPKLTIVFLWRKEKRVAPSQRGCGSEARPPPRDFHLLGKF